MGWQSPDLQFVTQYTFLPRGVQRSLTDQLVQLENRQKNGQDD
jgi:hypothetical protein